MPMGGTVIYATGMVMGDASAAFYAGPRNGYTGPYYRQDMIQIPFEIKLDKVKVSTLQEPLDLEETLTLQAGSYFVSIDLEHRQAVFYPIDPALEGGDEIRANLRGNREFTADELEKARIRGVVQAVEAKEKEARSLV